MSKPWDQAFMDICGVIARQSECVSHSVGAVITLENSIVATGFNRTFTDANSCQDHFVSYSALEQSIEHHEWSRVNELHAEQDAIVNALRTGITISGATIYCSFSPCEDCMKLIVASGISRVVYEEEYSKSNPESINLARLLGIKVEQIDFYDIDKKKEIERYNDEYRQLLWQK